MKTFLLLASLVMLGQAEPPTSYSSFSSGSSQPPSSGVSFQNVPSVASLNYSPSSSRAAAQNGGYSNPSYQSQPSISYGTPQPPPQQSYATPSPSTSHQGAYPSGGYQTSSSNSYESSPNSDYHASSQPANVQISYGAPPQLPPGSSYGPPPVVTGAGPDHEIEYRVVYKPVKAPKPDLVLPPPPPKQKTIVYILVPRIEAPEPIIVPTHPPTPPSKPEVYFIRYKAPKKTKAPNTLYGVPSSQYGVASAPKPVLASAPTPTHQGGQNKKREIVTRVSSSSSEVEASEAAEEGRFGDKVKATSGEKGGQ